jgi:ribosomal protein S18 acetylase RimI-like enzyme
MTQEKYRFDHQEMPKPEDVAILLNGLAEEALKAKGLSKALPFAVFIKDSQDKVVGGVQGVTYYGCLYVDLLWLQDSFRRLGLGTKLMREAEKIGKERNCTFATVNTMDWEALPFYEKLGYVVEFTRTGYEKNSKKYLLTRSL